jgi:hypothetical protein
MKLIFKSDSSFSTEFKEVLGFVDADISYRQIRPDLITATKDVVSVIGKPTYEAIISAYEKTDRTEDEMHLCFLCQAAVGQQAYRYFAPLNDLAHTPNGRKMRNSSEEANPFAWMVDNNNDELQRRSYRALDDLIDFMDENLAVWKSSDAYKECNNLFISKVREFDTYFQINSRLLLLKLSPGIAICERDEILPRVGKSFFDNLKEKRKSNSELTDKENSALLIIQEACAYWALSWGLPRLQMQLFPEGVLFALRSERHSTNSRSSAEAMQIESMEQHFKRDANRALEKLEALMKSLNPLPSEEISVNDILPNESCKTDKFFDS